MHDGAAFLIFFLGLMVIPNFDKIDMHIRDIKGADNSWSIFGKKQYSGIRQ